MGSATTTSSWRLSLFRSSSLDSAIRGVLRSLKQLQAALPLDVQQFLARVDSAPPDVLADPTYMLRVAFIPVVPASGRSPDAVAYFLRPEEVPESLAGQIEEFVVLPKLGITPRPSLNAKRVVAAVVLGVDPVQVQRSPSHGCVTQAEGAAEQTATSISRRRIRGIASTSPPQSCTSTTRRGSTDWWRNSQPKTASASDRRGSPAERGFHEFVRCARRGQNHQGKRNAVEWNSLNKSRHAAIANSPQPERGVRVRVPPPTLERLYVRSHLANGSISGSNRGRSSLSRCPSDPSSGSVTAGRARRRNRRR